MTLFFESAREIHIGFSAIFACLSIGFLFLRKVDKGEIGPGYWTLAFLCNSVGFALWSGMVLLPRPLYMLFGEISHILGFFLLAFGLYRFCGKTYTRRNLYAVGLWVLVWICSIVLMKNHLSLATFLLKTLRAVIFIWAGFFVLRDTGTEQAGKKIAGWSLIAWGFYMHTLFVVDLGWMIFFAYGLLVGFEIIAAFGLVTMVIGRMMLRAKKSEDRIIKLEGLLPICAYCKKIRDKDNNWQVLEHYIEERSSAEFSHGICPECFAKHRPDLH